MVILITGASHTGKTMLAQKLLEKYAFPYISIDHLKMGLIRSGYRKLTPESSYKDLTEYLWPVVREMIKTNIENKQNLIIEGCYIPFSFKKNFDNDYLNEMKFVCLIFSKNYIYKRYLDIVNYADVIENRPDESYCTKEYLIRENKKYLENCKEHELDYILIEDQYSIDINL